jgi:hypothetical protein
MTSSSLFDVPVVGTSFEALSVFATGFSIAYDRISERLLHRFGRCSLPGQVCRGLAELPDDDVLDAHGVVYVHGLYAIPCQFLEHVRALLEVSQGKVVVACPEVVRGGNAPLDDLVSPVLLDCLDFLRRGGRSLTLIGTSNGGRIVVEVEHALRSLAPGSPVMLVSIAGVLKGTQQMDLGVRTGAARLVVDHAVCEELSFMSRRAMEVVERLSSPVPEGCTRSFLFFATEWDMTVRPKTSALPEGFEECHRIVKGVGHSSIVPATATTVATEVTRWQSQLDHEKP